MFSIIPHNKTYVKGYFHYLLIILNYFIEGQEMKSKSGDLSETISYESTAVNFDLYWDNDIVALRREEVIKLIPLLQKWLKETED